MSKINRLKSILNTVDLTINNNVDLKKVFKIFVDNQFNLLIKIIKTKQLTIPISDLVKNNILSIFDEIQETCEEVDKLIKLKSDYYDESDNILYDLLFEEIDLLHFIIQYYILILISNKVKNVSESINNLLPLLEDQEFRNDVVNVIYEYFVKEINKRINTEIMENDYFNKFTIYGNKDYYSLVKVGLLTYKQLMELTVYSYFKQFKEIIQDMNLYLSKLLKLVSWKHWKTYSPNYDIENIDQSLILLSSLFVELYYLFIKTILYLNSQSKLSISDYKELHSIIFDGTIGEKYLIIIMLILYLYKNLENFDRQDNNY